MIHKILAISSDISLKMIQVRYKYTAHKKIMTGFACCGFDPYGAIISTGRYQKTLEFKSAKYVLF